MDAITPYLDALASAAPTPGGGSAAAVVGATGAALVAMAARITAKAPRLAAVADDATAIADAADRLRADFDHARICDEAAYGELSAAYALARDDDEARERRRAAIADALVGAAEAPLEIARLASETARLAVRGLDLGNAHLYSDLLCGAQFAHASAHAAAANVRINHRAMKDDDAVAEGRLRLERALRDAGDALARVAAAEPV